MRGDTHRFWDPDLDMRHTIQLTMGGTERSEELCVCVGGGAGSRQGKALHTVGTDCAKARRRESRSQASAAGVVEARGE